MPNHGTKHIQIVERNASKSWKYIRPNHGIVLHFPELQTIIWVNRGESNEELFEENS